MTEELEQRLAGLTEEARRLLARGTPSREVFTRLAALVSVDEIALEPAVAVAVAVGVRKVEAELRLPLVEVLRVDRDGMPDDEYVAAVRRCRERVAGVEQD